MIEWFQEVFQSSNDKARLISILITALVAILVLLLNQWFTNRRERKKLISEKIEEMYLTSIDYTNSAHQMLKDLQLQKFRRSNGYYDIDDVIYGNMNDSIRKMEMLCGLYFPEVLFDPADYSVKNMPVIDAATKGDLARETVDGNELYLKSRKHIDKAEKNLTSICKNLMKSKMV